MSSFFNIGNFMHTYRVLIKIGDGSVTTHVNLQADNDREAQLLAEAQYGRGNVIHWTCLTD